VHAFTRKQRLLLAIIPPLAAFMTRVLGATLRYRDITAPNTAVGIEVPGPTIFAFWHRTLLICAHRFRNHDIAILISSSFDGELIARTVELLGFNPVRGSSSRGGAGGLRAMADAYAEGRICAFTADGPRGPNMIAKAGPAQLAQLAGATWVGAYYALPDRLWELKSWDRFIIPKPFSTVTFTWPAHVAPDLAAVQCALDEAVHMVGGSAHANNQTTHH
jgi:lysophospholipid acyltransferase (LPLAT)-like uncharacterized protein